MKTSRTCLSLAMMLFALTLAEAQPTQPNAAQESMVDIAANNPLHAARLRKLHLVRPDLINYPLSFDVVC